MFTDAVDWTYRVMTRYPATIVVTVLAALGGLVSILAQIGGQL